MKPEWEKKRRKVKKPVGTRCDTHTQHGIIACEICRFPEGEELELVSNKGTK